ncbi:MAG TPA: hypothetical protein PKK67_01770, partial [Cyclobacteriaceae bacterium]|nr:hypothetical protein [Cyclobacteriaceae bacterium]
MLSVAPSFRNRVLFGNFKRPKRQSLFCLTFSWPFVKQKMLCHVFEAFCLIKVGGVTFNIKNSHVKKDNRYW